MPVSKTKTKTKTYHERKTSSRILIIGKAYELNEPAHTDASVPGAAIQFRSVGLGQHVGEES